MSDGEGAGDVTLLSPSELAGLLGVARERLTFEMLSGAEAKKGDIVVFNILIDGENITDEQEKIATAFLEKSGAFKSMTMVRTVGDA